MTAIDAFLRFGCTTGEPVEFAQTVDLGLGALMRWACDWAEVNVSIRDEYRGTPLSMAKRRLESTKVIEFLISCGAKE